jgi:hypothetical protein
VRQANNRKLKKKQKTKPHRTQPSSTRGHCMLNSFFLLRHPLLDIPSYSRFMVRIAVVNFSPVVNSPKKIKESLGCFRSENGTCPIKGNLSSI